MKIGRISGTGESGQVTIDGFAVDGVAEGLASSPTSLVLSRRQESSSIHRADGSTAALSSSAPWTSRSVPNVQPFSYAGAIETTAAIEVAAFSPRSLMHLLDVSPPETADPSVLSSLAIRGAGGYPGRAMQA